MTFQTEPVPDVRSRSTRRAHSDAVQLHIRDVVSELAEVLGRQLVGYLVGKDARTVLRWVNGTNQPPAEDEKRLRDAFQIYKVVAAVDGAHVVRAWFMGMNPQLDDAAPAELLANGQVRPVMAAARAFVQGG